MTAAGGRFRWSIAALLFCATALSFFDRQVLSVLSPKILADLNMTNVEYGRVVSAFTIAYSIMFLAGGRLIDYLGTRTGLGIMVRRLDCRQPAARVCAKQPSTDGISVFVGRG